QRPPRPTPCPYTTLFRSQPVVRAASPAASGQKHHGDQNKNMGKPSHPSTPLRSIYSSNSDDKAVSIFDQTKIPRIFQKKDRWRRRQNPAHAAGSCSPPRRSFGSFRPFHFLRPSGRFRFGRVKDRQSTRLNPSHVK